MKRAARFIFLNYLIFPLAKIKGALSSLQLLCLCVADGVVEVVPLSVWTNSLGFMNPPGLRATEKCSEFAPRFKFSVISSTKMILVKSSNHCTTS